VIVGSILSIYVSARADDLASSDLCLFCAGIDGRDDSERHVCLVSIEQRNDDVILVRNAVQSDVHALGDHALQLDHLGLVSDIWWDRGRQSRLSFLDS
jgi:hypothetical protein